MQLLTASFFSTLSSASLKRTYLICTNLKDAAIIIGNVNQQRKFRFKFKDK